MSERASLLPSPESNVDCIILNLFLEKLRSSPRQQKQTKRRNLGGGRGGGGTNGGDQVRWSRGQWCWSLESPARYPAAAFLGLATCSASIISGDLQNITIK